MRPIIAVVMVLSTSIASAEWIQVGKGTGPAKVSVGAASASGATVTVEIPGVQTESVAIDGVQYLKLTIPGAVSAVLDVGKPEVPAVPVLLARPTGSAVTLTILSIKTETLDVARVYPMQRPQKYGEQAEPLTVDNSFYASDVEYPSDRLSSPRTATWRDLDVVNVHVYPVTVRPAQHQVIVTSRIKFRVDFSGGHYPKTVASWMVPMYRRLVQNYDRLRLTTTAQEPPGTKCLVFCDTAYTANPALDSLLSLMTVLGDSAETIHVSSSWQPEDIKSAIIDRYDTTQVIHALHWVFLVGRYDQIRPKPNYRGSPYSDYWYSDLSGDSQGPLGCDNYPEVGIARLSPDNNTDLSHQIAKIRDYMMGTDADTWLNRMTLVAHKDSQPTHACTLAAQQTLGFYKDITRETILGVNLEVDNTDVTYSIEQGTGVLIYLGHGLSDRWDHWYHDTLVDYGWTTEDVHKLHNEHTPVVFNLACNCGAVDSGTCLSQKWMSTYDSDSSKGAVASFASYSSVHSYSADDQCMVAVKAIADYDTVTETPRYYGAPVFDLGGIQMLMDAYIATNWPDTLDNIYSFYWLGNPAMPVWSGGAPVSADVSYPSWITTGDTSFQVSVEIDGESVEGAQVCAYKPDDFYVVGLTDGSGKVTLSLTANDTGSFFVSVSKGHVNLSNRGWRPHTPMLPYFGTSVVCKPDSVMTYPNWGRKLVRDPGDASKLHVVYTARDSVFYTQSTDAGDSWSTAEPIGAGAYPAVGLPEAALGQPWVVYLASDGSIVRAIRNAAEFAPVWGTDTVFQSTDSSRAGAPSLAADVSLIILANAGVTYPVYVDGSPTQSYIYYNFLTQNSMSPPEVVDGPRAESCYGASIAATPGSYVHVAWARGESIYYRQRDTAWSAPSRISQSDSLHITEPASNPSVEAYGEYVYCVWCGPDTLGNFPGDVWRRSRWLDRPPDWWAAPSNQSESPELESDFPVMTTDFATVWQEQVSPDSTEIWGRLLTDMGPHPIYQTQLPSRYPHVDGYWPFPNTWLFRLRTVWTEQESLSPPKYKRSFGSHDYLPMFGKGLGPDPRRDYEPASYYAAELGQPKQSPYCLSRGGYAQFESWNTDTSATALTYQLPYLDPRRVYKLRAVLYHEGDGTWKADLRCDSGPWFHVKVAPRVPETVWVQVPKRMYNRDARVIVELARVTGGYVSLAKLKLFQVEEQPGDEGGVQSWGTGMTFVTRLRGCTPNPFARGTSINYELAQYGTVELTVHDVSGRMVSRLESGPRQRGFHAVRWDGTDGRGRVLPAGVYFVRFSAGGKVSTGRVTLIR